MNHHRRRIPIRERTQEGFTLVELIVSLGLFIIVIMAAVASLYSVNDTARKVESMRSVLDNLNFAVESMSRTIRTGTQIGCHGNAGVNCTFADGGGTQITIEGTLGRSGTMDYRHSIDGTGRGEIEKWTNGVWIPITAPGIDVQHLTFYVEGAETDDGLQPKVTMLIQGIAIAGENVAPFAVQTQVSVRTVEE